MNLIALNNFKSYSNQNVANFNPKLNLIIGKNGEGKSNFFRAINFILTDRVPLNRNQYNSYLHKVLDNDLKDIGVQVYFKSNQGTNQETIYKIERLWKTDLTEEFKIENTIYSRNNFQNFIQSLGLSYSNPYNIVQQGKITQITLMDQYEIFKLLQEATGIKKYEKRHVQAVTNMKKSQQEKQQINKTLKEIQEKVRLYQVKKEEFQYYNYQQVASKVKTKLYYEERLTNLSRELGSLRKDEVDKSDDINKIKIKQKEVENELQDVNQAIQIAKSQLFQYSHESFGDQQLQMNKKSIETNQKKYKVEINKIDKEKEKIKNKLTSKHNQVQKLRQQLEPYKEKYNMLTMQVQALKVSKQNKDKAKAQINDKIVKERNNIKQIDGELKKMQKYKSQFKWLDNKKQTEQIIKVKDKLNELNNEIKMNKIKIYECNRNKNQLESQANVLTNHTDNYYLKMRKILPLLEFQLLQEIKKEQIKGVYGYLIQFLQIQPNLAFAYEIASLNKLCTLLVEDQEACSHVVDLNRKIKGKQISILPLNFVKNQANQKKNYPKIQDCYSLLNQQWIKIKEHSHGPQFTKLLKKIIGNTFNKHLLVKDYETGLKISKEYHLNCITSDKEIIYSQGYLCKVGKDSNVDDRIEIYYKYAEKSHHLKQCKQKLTEVFKVSTTLQNAQLQLIKRKLIIQNDMRQLQLKIEQINDQKRSLNKLQQEQQQLTKKRKRYQQQIKQKQDLLSKIDNKKSSVNAAQYKQLEEIYKSKLDIFNKRCEEQYQFEQQYERLNKKTEEISEQINENHVNKSFQQEFNVEYVSNKQYKQQLNKKQAQLERKRKELEEIARKFKDQQIQNQEKNYEVNNQIDIVEEEIIFYEKEILTLGHVEESLQEIQERSNSFSVSFTRFNEQKKKKIHPFTTKQKLFFFKIASFREQMGALLKEYSSLEQTERKMNQLIQEYEKDKEHYLGQMFKTFQKEFAKIFKFITVNGKADIRLKKNADKSRGIVKYKNSISMFLSFERERQTRNWSQFSGGQKTVIAFCLLVALQKCQPAPFYILDEIDSALDPVYLQRIVHYIKEQCHQSQYFITSFKKEMMQFSEQICNYYHVRMDNRLSKIERISQRKAQELVQEIVG